ncbi:thioredoxin-disulfide reductase [Ehrlichia chaffeensis str. Heartland]|uniref:Thioredoxin reductase n=1 Tax=Ehrlichia chaffeensis (strain ATCC CRL-10679 / Arkansas) TaxID=205920 RepID=Q2GG96_EHRCR|nr:thioredoxin-disulfide reductase [Ehrlichia chaffeensis]ABD44934.1 thioredoxin-disulfide reductase [Ehrlichia chaffeensis str. Arkansas]AHX03802.1 thioredoxin-disulfide reductase [Ehrlichia chaffeensis str. Heartland]AHX05472.1 thioredoxin-disulfide reductase [Ehrlichia chaffeensis str. Jax]AHX06460.1 thioredoxin-disulfide reductase [Ehrlichia chaffeensis str. Liberty]AHX07334.1 thioredoxin-disulfide reductase [Ehrlichia chaffeensis str. Osceola]
MTQTYNTKVLIIGSGAAGCTAAIYAARANLKPILITGMCPGGQLTITTDVENFPGFAHAVQGPDLMEQMKQQAHNSGAQIISDEIKEIHSDVYPFKCIGIFGDQYIADSIIIATGAQAKWLNIKSEETFKGRGVSACATCDGTFFAGSDIAVIGGGNTAVEEALYLTRYATKVFLIHRRDTLRAEPIMQERLFSNDKIQVIWNSVVEEILGNKESGNVEAIALKSVKTGDITTISVKGVFIAIGHTPNTQILTTKDNGNIVDLDNEGYIITKPGSTVTSHPGIFAAGDVQDKIYRQAVVAAGSGCMAALEAAKFLSEQ